METVNLIPLEELKTITSISDSIDNEAIQGFLTNAQYKYIESAVGKAMYEDLIQSVLIGDDKYDDFMQQYLYPALSFCTLQDFLPFNIYKIQKKGITKASADDSTPVDNTELSVILKRTESTASFYLNRMVKYLDENQSDFPLYRGKNCGYAKTRSHSIFIPR